jgi:hypothetical protein
VTVSPATVTGGAGSTGTVTLSGPARAGGAVVTLADDSASVTVSPSVTVASGATTATFAVTTTTVTVAATATIRATYGTVVRTAALALSPVSSVPVAQDAGFPKTNVYGWTTGSKGFSFTTPGTNRLVVVAISYTNYNASFATAHTVSGGGLVWTKAREALRDGSSTYASLWYTWVPAAGNYTATFNPGATQAYDAFLTVHSFSGSSAAGIGAAGSASGNGTLPRVGPITTTASSSYILAVGYADTSTAPTVDASSTRTALDSSAGPMFWTQRSTSTLTPGSYSIGLTAPATPSAWAMAAVVIGSSP